MASFRRSLVTALSLALLLLILSLLYYRPSSAHSYALHSSSRSSHSPRRPPSCDPYHLYGHLMVDRDVPENNRYHPFDKKCAAPQLFRALRDKLGRTSDEAKKAGYAGWMNKGEDMEWVRGKTVLMLGDSTVREQLVQFCDVRPKRARGCHLSISFRAHRSLTSYALWFWRQFIGQPHIILTSSGAPFEGNVKRGGRSASLPRSCYSPELDFLLVSVFHFGVDEEDYWRDKDQYNPPGLFETRVKVSL